MSSKKEMFVNVFNNKLMEFVKEIIEIHPDNKDFKSMRSQLRMIISSTPNLPIEKFKKYVSDIYRDNINDKNEDFFLKLNLTGTPFESFNYLKNMWEKTSNVTKNAIWDYIILLTKLSDKY